MYLWDEGRPLKPCPRWGHVITASGQLHRLPSSVHPQSDRIQRLVPSSTLLNGGFVFPDSLIHDLLQTSGPRLRLRHARNVLHCTSHHVSPSLARITAGAMQCNTTRAIPDPPPWAPTNLTHGHDPDQPVQAVRALYRARTMYYWSWLTNMDDH